MPVESGFVDVYFNGGEYKIQGSYYDNNDKNSPAVLILPADPKYGGNIKNKVIVNVADVFLRCGFSVLAINYRGVGNSGGVFTKKEDAVFDATNALEWLENRHSLASHFWIVGYSFGCWVGSNIIMRRPEVENFIFISPVLKKQDYSLICPSLCEGTIICGEKDDFTTMEQFSDLASKMNDFEKNPVGLISIEGANHLYKNKLGELEKEVENYINISLATRIAKPVRKKRRKRKKKDSII